MGPDPCLTAGRLTFDNIKSRGQAGEQEDFNKDEMPRAPTAADNRKTGRNC